jgi:tetratricopeptide (TPR) repeat protein
MGTMLLPRVSLLAALMLPTVVLAQEPETPETPVGPEVLQEPEETETPGDAEGTLEREEMWRAPTAEEWATPCLITWQRTFEDAWAVSEATGKRVLVCVNMDGEIASEHYAGVRYRQPTAAVLYEPYVCVIASTYRHTPRDHDEDGERIPCPRFGTVTCGEHIAIEPILYEKYFEGKRISPRHIALSREPELEAGEVPGEEVYDVYYAFDTKSVFKAIRTGTGDPPEQIMPDRSLADAPRLTASRDVGDREFVERAYRQGTRAERTAILQAAVANTEIPQVDLLRLALFGKDDELRQVAWKDLSENAPDSAVVLLGDALEVMTEEAERGPLIDALDRLGKGSRKATTLARVHRGLGEKSEVLNAEEWTAALVRAEYRVDSTGRLDLADHLQSRADQAETSPQDTDALLELADSYLRLAVEGQHEPRFRRLLLEDARRTAAKAEEMGVDDWRVHSIVAAAAQELGETANAQERAALAVRSMPADTSSWSTMMVLDLFASGRQRAIADSYRDKREWPREWLTDLHAAHALLAVHPHGRDEHAVRYYDFLAAIGAGAHAQRVLDEGLGRFPDSWDLHARLRTRVLRRQRLGAFDGLEAVYEAMMREPDASPQLHWFAGYASLVVAEQHRRVGDGDSAKRAYDRAAEHYEKAIVVNPANRATSDHYVAMALAGRGRLALEAGEHGESLELILGSFARRREASASLDGLGISAVGTAKMLLVHFKAQDLEGEALRLQSALDSLEPEWLMLPENERGGRPSRDARRFRRSRGSDR